MAQTAQEIVNDIDEHLTKSRAKFFSNFYIGITNDINRRLFGEHNVAKSGHWYIYRQAIDDEHSRAVEKYYLAKGMKGGDGGGDNTCIYVYCYEISSVTIKSNE